MKKMIYVMSLLFASAAFAEDTTLFVHCNNRMDGYFLEIHHSNKVPDGRSFVGKFSYVTQPDGISHPLLEIGLERGVVAQSMSSPTKDYFYGEMKEGSLKLTIQKRCTKEPPGKAYASKLKVSLKGNPTRSLQLDCYYVGAQACDSDRW